MTDPDPTLSEQEVQILELLAESPRKPIEPEDIGYQIGHSRTPRKALSSLRKRGFVRKGKLYGEFTTYLITDAGLQWITGDQTAVVGRLLGARAEAFDGFDPLDAVSEPPPSSPTSVFVTVTRPQSSTHGRRRRRRSKQEIKGCGCLIVLATLLLLGLFSKCQTP